MLQQFQWIKKTVPGKVNSWRGRSKNQSWKSPYGNRLILTSVSEDSQLDYEGDAKISASDDNLSEESDEGDSDQSTVDMEVDVHHDDWPENSGELEGKLEFQGRQHNYIELLVKVKSLVEMMASNQDPQSYFWSTL